MNRKLLRYALRVARECKQHKPLDMKRAKQECKLADIREIMRPKE